MFLIQCNKDASDSSTGAGASVAGARTGPPAAGKRSSTMAESPMLVNPGTFQAAENALAWRNRRFAAGKAARAIPRGGPETDHPAPCLSMAETGKNRASMRQQEKPRRGFLHLPVSGFIIC
ncbi:MAG: hypothetical protein C6W57_08090 [Caldibacillus debilis]|nr:MAG: hypothetical protein C6W57_08090 [Caldibacillus debilis]